MWEVSGDVSKWTYYINHSHPPVGMVSTWPVEVPWVGVVSTWPVGMVSTWPVEVPWVGVVSTWPVQQP